MASYLLQLIDFADFSACGLQSTPTPTLLHSPTSYMVDKLERASPSAPRKFSILDPLEVKC